MARDEQDKYLLKWNASVMSKNSGRVYRGILQKIEPSQFDYKGRSNRHDTRMRSWVASGILTLEDGNPGHNDYDGRNRDGLRVRIPLESLSRLISGAEYFDSDSRKKMIRVLQKTRDELIRQDVKESG